MMNIKTEYHDKIFDEFMQYRPDLKDSIRCYEPKHLQAIRITLTDGRQIDYNGRTRTFREVCKYYDENPNTVTDEKCREIFASNLAEIMRSKGFKQPDLAERTGLSTAAISKYLKQKATPTITTLEKIANALNCSREELLD